MLQKKTPAEFILYEVVNKAHWETFTSGTEHLSPRISCRNPVRPVS